MARLTQSNSYLPTVTLWNRLEGRPRAHNFDRALKAEVRDALWMISKQWQMGEFIGDDAGSPVLAKVHMETTRLTKYQAGTEPATQIENDIPLEVKVENQKLVFERAGQDISLDIRLLMGRHWLKLVAPVGADLKQAYIDLFGFAVPDPALEGDAPVCAHSQVWQQFSAAAERCMDGYRLYHYLKRDATHHAYDGIAEVDSDVERDAIDVLAIRFVEWYEKLYYQPIASENASWKPSYLEHQFSCSAPRGDQEKVLFADEYYHGHLDWYNLNIDQSRTELPAGNIPVNDAEGTVTRTFIPTSVTFGGMPHPRWWTFENWKTNLGFIKPDTTDLNKLLLLDFFLTYSNDWFIVPFTLPVGSLADIRGLLVTNVFGEKTWVDAAGRGPDEAWQRWNMYTLAIQGSDNVAADMTAVVLPVARKVQECNPLEEIFLLRDEMANMVWGVETRVALPNGKGRPGRETAYEFKSKLQQLIAEENPPVEEVEFRAAIRYQVVNSVPEFWIPFVPVHIEDSNREIQLQRAALPRILEGNPAVPKKVEPRTSLLREGLDATPKLPFFLHEEEVARSGIRVRKSFQRTRWFQGRVFTWLGIRKQVGRGEGHSGLAFDQIMPTE